MDVFAQVCEALRADDLARLRRYPTDGSARARFSTWLVTVVHHLTVDWFRHRDGREQAAPPSALTPQQQDIYQAVFLERRPHLEAYELLRVRSEPRLEYRVFVQGLRVAQRAFNAARPRLRPRTVSLPSSLADPASEEADAVEVEEAQRRVEELLATHDPEERLALKLFVVNEMSAADVARTVGWPDAKAVYNRVSRLLKTLRRELSVRGIGPGDL
jgi:RNA polymerase sigma factor (sigma-70 family)